MITELTNQPKMVESYTEISQQKAFCFAFVTDSPDVKNGTLLFTVLAGSDSALQSIKAMIDGGYSGISFGHGVMTNTGYDFEREFFFRSEKGKYTTYPMTLDNHRKGLAIVHERVFSGEYILSYDGNPGKEVANFFGKYGLFILPEWEAPLLFELQRQGYLTEVNIYKDSGVFSDLSIFHIKIDEIEADELVSRLIKEKKLQFPVEGTGKNIEGIDNLTDYMGTYHEMMAAKLAKKISPLHDPIKEDTAEAVDKYKRPLFPVQAHVATAVAKALNEHKSVIIQGEMSSGKSAMMTAVADIVYSMKGKKGYFGCLMVPPSLTDKWATEEIKFLLPHARVFLIKHSKELIDFHTKWTNSGRPKPTVPTFFVISYTTMRGDSAFEPAVTFKEIKTKYQKEHTELPYRYGYYCPSCGMAHQVNDKEEENSSVPTTEDTMRSMDEDEFGTTRRLTNGKMPANAFCSACGESLWTRRVPNRYQSYKEWNQLQRQIEHAAKTNPANIRHLLLNQPDIKKAVGKPRRVSAIEYIRRKMKNFFDISIVDEVHELKGGMTAQGNSLGSLAACSKKVVAGTGTLFGGLAQDIYYTLWRLFPTEMVNAGYKYSELTKWNQEYGNIETTTTEDQGEYSNKQSRGGVKRTSKVVPGISPYVFGKFLLQHSVLVRLKDVWPDPVEFVDVPTILVDLDEDLQEGYKELQRSFESAIQSLKQGRKLYLPYSDCGIAYPDNPFTFPAYHFQDDEGLPITVWEPKRLDENRLLNKEKKLKEIITREISENRASIIYVRDTGSSREERDMQPRLQKVLSQVEGAKVAILRAGTTGTDQRSKWLRRKVEQEGYNVIIVSSKLVKVGLDLLCTPTLIFYQFDWSLFTMNQAARRAFRIGQTEECRLFYLAYKDTMQESMAQLIAQKNKASQALNGDVSSDGLNAMLGDDGDLQTMLIKSIKKGETIKGSSEEWIAQTSDRARELLRNVGKPKKVPNLAEQLMQWLNQFTLKESTINVIRERSQWISQQIERGKVPGFGASQNVLSVDLIQAFGIDFVDDQMLLEHLIEKPKVVIPAPTLVEISKENSKKRKKNDPIDGQLGFELFA